MNRQTANRLLAQRGFQLELSKVEGSWYLVGEDATLANDTCLYHATLYNLHRTTLLEEASRVRREHRRNEVDA